ncbi:MAG: VanZ family protein [Calothrix sp. C42_A2020_038]|nr:VanZ family protein [Calothrix sp. C42_A2020_038]
MKDYNSYSVNRLLGIPVDLILLIGSILVVAIATLYPYNFSIPENFSLHLLLERFDNTSFFKDQVENVLLFMPFGCGLASILMRKGVQPLIQILVVVFAGASLSCTVEFLQIFLPSRDPTPADIVNNTIGSFIGLLSLYILDARSFRSTLNYIENSQLSNSRKAITIFFSGYILLTFLIGFSWENNTTLSHWSQNFPLLIGNELTGDRPWQGSVSQILIAEKAISNDDVQKILSNPDYLASINLGSKNILLAKYKFNGKDYYRDITEKQPDLLWHGQASESQNESEQQGIFVDSSRWLETAEPVRLINQRIRQTSQFTIITSIASANPNQQGPARIISVSGGPLRRNFTLGQDQTDLSLRLRTPITGQNGADIRLSVPNVFSDTNLHKVIITYARGLISVYVNKPENAYFFNLLELYPKRERVFAYAALFIPLGFYLTLLTIIAKRKYALNQVLLISGTILPSLIIESSLVHLTSKSFSFTNVGLGIFFTAVTTFAFKVRAAISSNQLGVGS